MKSDCACCQPTVAATPVEVTNRSSLSAIAYRVGTYGSFREAMIEALAAEPTLRGLTTREGDDFAIMLLQMWSAVGDVLTFYQERYANESFLRTAAFRDSVVRLGALIDYRLRPGVAARTALVFTLDAGAKLTVPARQKVQSVPGPGEQPQTFETLEAVEVDARLNRLRVYPAPASANPLAAGVSETMLDSLAGAARAARLAAGDPVVLFNDGGTARAEEKRIAALRRQDDRVAIVWTTPVAGASFDAATNAWKYARTFRVFGHNVPPKTMVPTETAPGRISWTLQSAPSPALSASATLSLDGHPRVAVGQHLLIADGGSGGRQTLVRVTAVSEAQETFGALTDTVTRLTVSPAIPAIASRQDVTVYELTEGAIELAPIGYATTLSGDTVYLPGVARLVDGAAAVEVDRVAERGGSKSGVTLPLDLLGKGRVVLISDGKRVVRALVKATPRVQPAGAAPGTFCHLVVALQPESPLGHETAAAVLLGNVAGASHGETVTAEVIGSGNESARFQKMSLKKSPLTYLPAPTDDGVASTLELSVSGVRWKETPQLFGQGADARLFELRHGDDLTASLRFGDGVTGRPLPTGRNNIVATYRVGAGVAGRVPAGALTTLLGKPPGVAAATNPLAAEGGADPETLASARQRAPRTVRTFGRIVSLQDFEDQVTFSGEVQKAQAAWIWDGLERAVFLTVAQDGPPFTATALGELGANLARVRDSNHRLLIGNHRRVFVEIEAAVAVDAAYDRDAVLVAARAAALDLLSFERGALAQAIHLSDLYAALQAVAGVVFVDVNRFLYKRPPGLTDAQFAAYVRARGGSTSPGGTPAVVQEHLRVFAARPNPAAPGSPYPAELAALEVPTDDLVLTARLP